MIRENSTRRNTGFQNRERLRGDNPAVLHVARPRSRVNERKSSVYRVTGSPRSREKGPINRIDDPAVFSRTLRFALPSQGDGRGEGE